jgi:hypothetical protein
MNPPSPIKQEDGVPPAGGPLPEQVEDSNYRPIKTFADLMAIKDLHQRLETFDVLPEWKKVVLLYPYRSEGLPARDPYPENWDSMLASAYDTVKTKIESSFSKNQASVRPSQTTVNEYSDDDSSEEEEDSLYEKHVVRATTHASSTSSNKNNNNTTSNVSSAERDQLKFLENLPRCLPIITYGFHVDRHNRETNEAFCFCPCDRNTSPGTVAGRWRTLCDMDNILTNNICNKKKLIQKKPTEFLDHVRTVKAGCAFHRILYDYLEELYSNFYAPHKKHIGFFRPNDADYKAAKRDIKRKEVNQDVLAAKKMRKVEAELRQVSDTSTCKTIYVWSAILSTNKHVRSSIIYRERWNCRVPWEKSPSSPSLRRSRSALS